MSEELELVSRKPVMHTATQKKVARALAVCGEVAKLYKKYGKPPVWISITGSSNRALRRQRMKK